MQDTKPIQREEIFREIENAERNSGRKLEKFQEVNDHCEKPERVAQDIHSGLERTEEKSVNIICQFCLAL